jgi:hypothetical protein
LKRVIRRADARQLGGRVKPGHGEIDGRYPTAAWPSPD